MPRRRANAPGPAQEVLAPMQRKRSPRRPAGTGSLLERSDRAGRRSWYGKFHAGERQVKRRLGPVREPGSSLGLTRRQAEAALRNLIEREGSAPVGPERVDLAIAAERYIHHVEHLRGRRATTVADYRANVGRHLAPFFAGRSLEAIDPQMVEAYLAAKLREGLTRKTIQNHLTLYAEVTRKSDSMTSRSSARGRKSRTAFRRRYVAHFWRREIPRRACSWSTQSVATPSLARDQLNEWICSRARRTKERT